MIYRALWENSLLDTIAGYYHFLGEELLSYGLFLERGINYRNEFVIRNKWGKPSLKNHPDVRYNVSHCENYTACVISYKHAVGIDVEKVRSFSPHAARRTCSSEELQRIYSKDNPDREFFRYWTLKESYIKAIGMGLSYPMKDVNFDIKPDGEICSSVNKCLFLLLEDIEGFITAVCYKGK